MITYGTEIIHTQYSGKHKKRIVIAGGGFAGLETNAIGLSRHENKECM